MPLRATLRATLRSILLAALLAYAGMCGYLYLKQDSLIYLPELPTRAIEAVPGDIGLAYEAVTLHAEDGVALRGWYLPHPEARGTVLFFHGNAGNISHRLDSLRIFHELGMNVFIFDYRGYGLSEGSPSEAGIRRDALAAWRYLTVTRGESAQDIVLFGRSLGGGVASWLATQVRPRGLILESTFTSVPEIGAELYPWLPVRLLAKYRYDSRANLAAIHCPVLVAHSPEDEIIPFAHGEALFAAARGPKAFLRLRGGHNMGFIETGRDYVEGLARFLGNPTEIAPR